MYIKKVKFDINLERMKLKIKKKMDWNIIKITNIWTKLRFKQWLDMCHLTDLTHGTIVMWHVAWIIFKKKKIKNLKKWEAVAHP